MTTEPLPSALTDLPDAQVAPDQTRRVWRTRLVAGSTTRSGLTLALDFFCQTNSPGTPPPPRGRDTQALDVVLHLTEIATRKGFRVELRPARPCNDPQDGQWICAALLCLTRPSSRGEPGRAVTRWPAAVTLPPLPLRLP
jgi:hypothetical protein